MSNKPIDHKDSDNEGKENNEKEIDERNKIENEEFDQRNKIENEEFEKFKKDDEEKKKKLNEKKKKIEEEENKKFEQYNKNRFEIKDIFIKKKKYDKENFYDIIIKINLLNELIINGWEIYFSPEFNKKSENPETNPKNKLLIPVCVIGESNKGKSYLSGKITNQDIPEGFNEKTEGISLKYLEELNCILIDSAGGQTPIIKSDNSDKYFINLYKQFKIRGLKKKIEKKDEKNNEEEILKMIEEEKNKEIDIEKIKNEDENIYNICLKKLISDKSITEQFIKDFVMFTSKLIIIVVGQLTISEQLFIYNLKKNISNSKEIIIVHNLLNFVKIKQVEDYLEQVLLKSIYFNLEETTFYEQESEANNQNKKKNNKKFYLEKFDGLENKQKITIRHLIYANDSKESEAGNFYNYSTIKIIRNAIEAESERKNNFDIIEELKKYLDEKSYVYMELNDEQNKKDKLNEKFIRPIKYDNIKIEEILDEKNQKKNDSKKFIMKLDDKISNLNMRKLKIDETGNFKYTGNSFVPTYYYYKETVNRNFLVKDFKGDEDVDVLIIMIELPGKIEGLRPKINLMGNGKYFISISGVKKLPQINDFSYLYSDLDENEFRIEFEIGLEEIEIKETKPIKNITTKDGIIKLYYELKNEENKEIEIKIDKKEENKEGDIKKKKKKN